MNFRIDKEVLNAKLNLVSHALAAKLPLPVLTCVKIDVEDEGVILTASDSQISIRTTIKSEQVEIETTGSVLVDGKTFCNVIRVLRNGTIEFNREGTSLNIFAGKSKYQLNTMSASDYPNIDFNVMGKTLDMPMKEFTDIIKKTIVSVGTSEKKPILTGVNLESDGSKIKFTATDAFRLSRYEFEKGNGEAFNITIPATGLNELLKCDTNYEDATIEFSMNKIVFKFGGTVFITRLLEGNYPATDKLLDLDFTDHIKINREDLINAVERISIISPNDSKEKEIAYNVVKFKVMDENNIKISVDNIQLGRAHEILELADKVAIVGKEFAFSGKNILSALYSYDSEYVTLNYLNEAKPFTITSENDLNLRQLVLPVRIN